MYFLDAIRPPVNSWRGVWYSDPAALRGILDHFAAEDWVDLVRGKLPSPKATAMQTHLEEGCVACLRSSETWRLIVEMASREARYQPAESVVRIAKSAYVPETRWGWMKEAAVFTRLIFDSFQNFSQASLRGSKPMTRQLVHEAEPFVIDLRLESDPARKRIFLMGQILNSENPEEVISDVEVVLLAGEKLIRRGAVNASGEFDLELGSDANQHLFINIRGQRAIGIALPHLES